MIGNTFYLGLPSHRIWTIRFAKFNFHRISFTLSELNILLNKLCDCDVKVRPYFMVCKLTKYAIIIIKTETRFDWKSKQK